MAQYDVTIQGGLGLGLLGFPQQRRQLSSNERIGGEKVKVEKLETERSTGLGGDYLDVDDDDSMNEKYDGNKREENMQKVAMKRAENERIDLLEQNQKRELSEKQPLTGDTNVGLGIAAAAAAENVDDPLWSPKGTTQRLRDLKSPLVRLHGEIVDFCRFLEPTEEEEKERIAAFERVKTAVLTIWPSARFEMHGSFATKMYLPSSDIDACVLDSGAKSPVMCLKALALYLARRGEATKIQLITTAKVPIVKFEETKSKVQFDISFDVANGPASAEIVKKNTRRFPALRPLTTVLKCFLAQRGLNEVYSGGIGSYALLCMIMTFLQLRESIEASEWAGERGREDASEGCLGTLLIDFFELYGRKLNAEEIGISCGDKTGSNRFFIKSEKNFYDERRPFLLSIQDPQDSENDLGRNSYAWRSVKAAFEHAFTVITAPVGGDKEIFLLGRIVKMDSEMMKNRAAPAKTGSIRGVFSDFQSFVESEKEKKAGVTPRNNRTNKKKQKQKVVAVAEEAIGGDPNKKRSRWENANESSSSEEEEGALKVQTMIKKNKRNNNNNNKNNDPMFEITKSLSLTGSSSSSSKDLQHAMNKNENEYEDDDDDEDIGFVEGKKGTPKRQKSKSYKNRAVSRGQAGAGRGRGRGRGYFSKKRSSN